MLRNMSEDSYIRLNAYSNSCACCESNLHVPVRRNVGIAVVRVELDWLESTVVRAAAGLGRGDMPWTTGWDGNGIWLHDIDLTNIKRGDHIYIWKIGFVTESLTGFAEPDLCT